MAAVFKIEARGRSGTWYPWRSMTATPAQAQAVFAEQRRIRPSMTLRLVAPDGKVIEAVYPSALADVFSVGGRK